MGKPLQSQVSKCQQVIPEQKDEPAFFGTVADTAVQANFAALSTDHFPNKRVLIADDQQPARQGLKALLTQCPKVEVVGELPTGRRVDKCAYADDGWMTDKRSLSCTKQL